MGWLTKLTDWFREQIIAFFTALQAMLEALFMVWLKQSTEVATYIIGALPVPDFLANYSLCTLLSQTGPTVGWLLNTFRIGEGLGLIAAGFSFRLVRKLATLFQW